MKKYLFLLVLPVLFLSGFVFAADRAHAADLEGWGWSSNFGWISFNSANAGAGTGAAYKVTLSSAGVLDGYAWSPHLGWISFDSDDVDNCPNESTATPCPPTINSSGIVKGWARSLSNSADVANSYGWIELAGTNHESGDEGVTYNPTTGVLDGFAWGGDLGWFNFYDVICEECGPIVPPETPPNAPNLSLSNTCGGTITIVWTMTGDTYRIYRDGALIDTTGSNSYTDNDVNSGQSYDYEVRAVNSAGTSGPSNEVSSVPSADCEDTGGIVDIRIGTSINAAKSFFDHATRGLSITINQGEPFALAWKNNHDATSILTCTAIEPTGEIDGFTTATVRVATGETLVSAQDSSGIDEGTYSIKISCGGVENKVTLSVQSSSEQPQ